MHQVHTYDLAFVETKRRPRTAPELIFIIAACNMSELVNRLQTVTDNCTHYIHQYLQGDEAVFIAPSVDLFGCIEFGYRRCGYVTTKDDEVYFHLPLRSHPWTHYVVLTVFVMARALGFPFRNAPPKNHAQQVALMTSAEWRSGGYGHAVGGMVSESVMTWLRSYARERIERLGIIEAAPMHPEVLRAQQMVADVVRSSPRVKYRARSSTNFGWVRETGAFTLNCYGDACDLSVYPDQVHPEGAYEWTALGCHNLDNADQQLILLAGLAKILQLARESP